MLPGPIAPIGRSVGHGDRAPQVEIHGQGTRLEGFRGPARVAQLAPCRFRLRRQVGAFNQARLGQGCAAGGPERGRCRRQRRDREAFAPGQCAGHQQRRLGGVVVQAARAFATGKNVRLPRHHRVKPVALQLRGAQHGAAAIGNADGDDPRVVEVERAGSRQRFVELMHRKLGRLAHVPAPVGLGVVLRVRVRNGHAAGTGRGVRSKHRVPRLGGRIAAGIEPDSGIQVEVVAAGALVGIGHRAAARQAPGAGDGDRAVDPARARGSGHHHARLAGVECVGQLQHHPVRMIGTRQPGQGVELAAGHCIHAAVALAHATRAQVGDAAPVGPHRALPQLGGRGLNGIGEGRGHRSAQTGQSQPRREQIVRAAVFADAQRAEVHGGAPGGLSAGHTGRKQQRGQRRQDLAQRRAEGADMSGFCLHAATIAAAPRPGIVLWYQQMVAGPGPTIAACPRC